MKLLRMFSARPSHPLSELMRGLPKMGSANPDAVTHLTTNAPQSDAFRQLIYGDHPPQVKREVMRTLLGVGSPSMGEIILHTIWSGCRRYWRRLRRR